VLQEPAGDPAVLSRPGAHVRQARPSDVDADREGVDCVGPVRHERRGPRPEPLHERADRLGHGARHEAHPDQVDLYGAVAHD